MAGFWGSPHHLKWEVRLCKVPVCTTAHMLGRVALHCALLRMVSPRSVFPYSYALYSPTCSEVYMGYFLFFFSSFLSPEMMFLIRNIFWTKNIGWMWAEKLQPKLLEICTGLDWGLPLKKQTKAVLSPLWMEMPSWFCKTGSEEAAPFMWGWGQKRRENITWMLCSDSLAASLKTPFCSDGSV